MNIIETDWKWSSGLSKRASTDYIALHHAAAKSCSAADVDRWHKSNGWSGIGYHYFIRKDGSIYRGRPEWSMGAHVQGMNACSLGICAEGDYDKETEMPAAQYNAIIYLIEDIHSRYPSAKVVGHREIGASDCPGKYYPLNSIKNGIKQESEDLTVTQYEELKQLIAAKDAIINTMGQEIAELKQKVYNPMIYNYVDSNMPEWARDDIQWCINNDIIKGTGEGLGLDDKDLKTCSMIRRAVTMVCKLIGVNV